MFIRLLAQASSSSDKLIAPQDRALISLVLTTCTNRYFQNFGDASPADHDRLWKQSVTNAISSRLIARRIGYVEPKGENAGQMFRGMAIYVLVVFVVVAGMGFVVIRHVVVKQHQQNTATELTKLRVSYPC